MERHAYFFKGARYLRYNLDTDLVDVGPDDIARFWPRLPAEFQSNLDAVLNWGDGHAYFFKGPRYLRYDVDNDLVDVAPVEISANWPKLRNDFQAGVDAAVNWGDGFAYFFKGRLYCRYNIDADVVDVGPTDIFPNWKLPEEMHSGIDAAVNWGDGHAYLFKGARYVRMNIATDLVDVGPTEISRFWTHLPAEFHSGLSDVVNWNLRLHWERRSDDERFRYVMERLVDHYGYPDTGAAGLVGNLHAESQVIPTRIEGSATATPMRAKNFQGRTTDFSATDVMNRSQRAGVGPVKPGIGLAQWTSGTRRSGLFNHPFAGDALGARVVFNMEAQLDYLVHELRNSFGGVERVIANPGVTVDDASDEVVYNFEVPGSVLQGRRKRPRTDPQVQGVFRERRRFGQRALSVYRAAIPVR